MSLPESLNADYIESQYHQWKNDPDSVSKDWQYFFQGFEIASVEGMALAVDKDKSPHARQANVESLIYEYRNIGHMLACMDPLSACPTEHPLLALGAFDLNPEDLNREFAAADLQGSGQKLPGQGGGALWEICIYRILKKENGCRNEWSLLETVRSSINRKRSAY